MKFDEAAAVPLKIHVYKHKNVPHYEWESNLLETNGNYLLAYSEPNRELVHHSKNATFIIKNSEILFTPFDNWYTVSIYINEAGGYSYYCNICAPPCFENNILSFIDYDLDVVYNGSKWETVDWDDFDNNSKKYAYPPDLIDTVIAKEKELRGLIENKKFPFDGWLLGYADIYLDAKE